MRRFVISVAALAGILAAANSALADEAATPDYTQAAAAKQQAASPAPAWSTSSDAAAPVGFGWG